jgi:hypothetical protein
LHALCASVLYNCNSQIIPVKMRKYHPLAQQPTWKTIFVSYLSNHFTLQTCTYVKKRNVIVQIYLKKLGENNNAPSLDYPMLYKSRVLYKLSNYVRGRTFSTQNICLQPMKGTFTCYNVVSGTFGCYNFLSGTFSC